VERDAHSRKTPDGITNSISKQSIPIQIHSFPWSINLDENNPIHSRLIYVIQFTWQFIAQSILMLYICVNTILLGEQKSLFKISRKVQFWNSLNSWKLYIFLRCSTMRNRLPKFHRFG